MIVMELFIKVFFIVIRDVSPVVGSIGGGTRITLYGTGIPYM